MKTVTNGYKNQIKEMGREIDSIIRYFNHYQVITENNKFILTEDGQKILTEQIKSSSYVDMGAEDIYSCKVITHGNLLKTMMKEFDFEVKQDIKIGSIINYRFGLKVNNAYEYIDYGDFIVQNKEFNEDTQTYSYIAYDKMLFTMVPYKEQNLSEFVGAYTLFDLADYCCQYCDLNLGVESFPNSEREITDDTLKVLSDSNFTFRDVLDYLTEVTGCSSYMIGDDFVITSPTGTGLILHEDSFKDTNVKFSKTFGPINSIIFSRSDDVDFIEMKDEASISQYGVTQIKIKDNPFLEGNDRSDYFEEMFDVLNGLTYTLNDLSSVGITYLEYFDKFNVNIGGNIYPCLLLNDEIIVEQGLEESIFTEEVKEAEHEYATSAVNVDDVSLRVDKVNRQIVLKIDSDGKLATAELKQNADDGTEFNVKADNINLEGYTTINDGFSIDLNGNMTCNNATITGGVINMESENSNPHFIIRGINNDYRMYLDGNGISVTDNGTEYEGGTIGYETKMSLHYSPWGYCTLGLHGEQSYVTIGNHYVSNNLITPVSLYDNNGGYVEVANSEGTNTIVLKGSNGNVKCVSLTQTSLEKDKKNIEEYSGALKEVLNTDIYKYNFKFEDENTAKHLGVVIGDKYKCSDEIIALDKDNKKTGVDTYSMISLCLQAIKEQQEQIEELKKKVIK